MNMPKELLEVRIKRTFEWVVDGLSESVVSCLVASIMVFSALYVLVVV